MIQRNGSISFTESDCPSVCCDVHRPVLLGKGLLYLTLMLVFYGLPGPGCSKLTTSLVNVSLNFQELFSQICQYFLLKKCEKLLQCKSFSHLEKLRNQDVACTFQAMIGGKFAPLIGLSDEDMDMDTMITTYNTAVTDAASEILGKERLRKKPWVTKDVLDLCDERRDLKKKRCEAEGAK